MTKKTRRFIFYTFFVLFVTVALVIIFYAQGFDFDWQNKTLFKGGAFYFKSYPKDADIYIDNQYQGRTNKFIKRLLPKEYSVKISKSNYQDWQKTMEVKSKLVTQAKNVLLIKNNLPLNLVTKNDVKYFSFSSDNKRVIYLTGPTLALHLIDIINNTDSQIYTVPELNKLANVLWSPDEEKILLSFSGDKYYFLSIKNPLEIINFNNLINTLSGYKIYTIENPEFHPQNSNQIYFHSKNKVYYVNLNSSNPSSSIISPAIISDASTYAIHNNEILYLRYSNGEFYKTNLDGSSFKKILDIPFFKSGQAITIINERILIVDNDLYFFDSQTQVLKKIAENVIKTDFSKDEKKLLWETKNEIGVIWLDDDPEPPLRKKYTNEIIVKTSKEIKQATWYKKTDQHIIFVVGDEINIIELDGRDKETQLKLLQLTIQKFFIIKKMINYIS